MEYEIAKEKAVKFLATSLKTEYEVRQKLVNLGYEAEIIDKVVNHLKDISYIDDKEYVSAYIRQCQKMKKYSIYEIKSKLKIKGISKDLIESGLCQLEKSTYEQDIVYAYINKHAKDDNNKVKAYLYRRGFKNFDF